MGRDWQELTKLVGQAPIEVERVRLIETGVAIEGPFTLPPLVQLTAEDGLSRRSCAATDPSNRWQVFRRQLSHRKNRLNKIGASCRLSKSNRDRADPPPRHAARYSIGFAGRADDRAGTRTAERVRRRHE